MDMHDRFLASLETWEPDEVALRNMERATADECFAHARELLEISASRGSSGHALDVAIASGYVAAARWWTVQGWDKAGASRRLAHYGLLGWQHKQEVEG